MGGAGCRGFCGAVDVSKLFEPVVAPQILVASPIMFGVLLPRYMSCSQSELVCSLLIRQKMAENIALDVECLSRLPQVTRRKVTSPHQSIKAGTLGHPKEVQHQSLWRRGFGRTTKRAALRWSEAMEKNKTLGITKRFRFENETSCFTTENFRDSDSQAFSSPSPGAFIQFSPNHLHKNRFLAFKNYYLYIIYIHP